MSCSNKRCFSNRRSDDEIEVPGILVTTIIEWRFGQRMRADSAERSCAFTMDFISLFDATSDATSLAHHSHE